MIFLRLACLAVGVLVLVAPPAALFPNGAAFPDLPRSILLLVALLAAASSFFFIGVSAHRIRRAPALGRLCALLLLAPFLLGAVTLWRSADPLVMWMSGALLCFTLLLSLVLAWLVLKGPSASRLRAREGQRARMLALRGY
ncbi:hypothetical protein [Massilia sp. X63]|uniref:hypothetical protein n=1 Tax=Massilia sp. X63 TaxID=3237285 RepID=UPI0034DD74BB